MLASYEKPNPFLYTFTGNIEFNKEKIALDNSCVMLRGSSLKNTKYVYGILLYSGLKI